jgi:uncharacterized membrane protein YebE (DUF533 family)
VKTNRVKYPKANLGGQSRRRAIRRRNQAMAKNKRDRRILYGVIAVVVAAGGYIAYRKYGKGKYGNLPQPPENAPIPPMHPQSPPQA